MLKAARNAAGLSREEAAHRLHVGSRTLASYELGETLAPPDVVMGMSRVYDDPTLPADYCAILCPIGQVLAHSLDRSEFAISVLRLLKEFDDVKKLLNDLTRIAADGQVNAHEMDEFKEIMREMIELERQIEELKFFALRQGIDVKEIIPLAG